MEVVENPLRLVIDIPGSVVGSARKKIAFSDEQIKGIRVSQYQPETTRVVVDLAAPVHYDWDVKGNRIKIQLRPDASAANRPESASTFAPAAQPIAVPYSESAGGALIEAGDRVSSGSSISAGEQMAVLRLARGGEIRVCPNTTVSVSTSATGRDLLLGMSTGAMETHYHLEDSSDSVLTPDFRIVFPGPGEFNVAVSADNHGNTCVSSLAGSTSSVVIAELLGNGSYEVKPAQQATFHEGNVGKVEQPLAPCGCPVRQQPVLRTSIDQAPAAASDPQSTLQLAGADDPSGEKIGRGADSASPKGQSKQEQEEDMKVQMEAPLVFSGKDIAAARAAKAPPAPVLEAAALQLTAKPAVPMPTTVVLPPGARPRKGLFDHLKGFFASIFR
jgi:hypothetical protein